MIDEYVLLLGGSTEPEVPEVLVIKGCVLMHRFFSAGSFVHQFNELGTYYYWSGWVKRKVALRGIVIVQEQTASRHPITFKVNGIQATRGSGGGEVDVLISNAIMYLLLLSFILHIRNLYHQNTGYSDST